MFTIRDDFTGGIGNGGNFTGGISIRRNFTSSICNCGDFTGGIAIDGGKKKILLAAVAK